MGGCGAKANTSVKAAESSSGGGTKKTKKMTGSASRSSNKATAPSSSSEQKNNNEAPRRQKNVIMPEKMSGTSYSFPEFAKSAQSTEIIMKALDSSLVFSGLLGEQKEAIVKSMEECRVAAGQLLIKQGDQGDAFYVVEAGRFDILVDGAGKVAETTVGGSFGELALIMNQPRAATVKASEDSLCWKIDRRPFRYFLATTSKNVIDEIYDELQSVQLLQGLPKAHLYKLAAHTSK